MTYAIPIDQAYDVERHDMRRLLARMRRDRRWLSPRNVARACRLAVDGLLAAAVFYVGIHADQVQALLFLR